ncbi:nucleotidyltransferase [Phyllobacterium sp. 628]|uniref:nucleotidyltransferase domain-containing protein n=1 Tax=Phyllobacterium sp. 628 TaxID=2718938 RepID=UPI0016622BCD|nr:nucleotidyltransferase domain-containing protein [Phyllobacterium sp. 628]QND51113.1 nucleotidyltransferase [Phyllobacterium sp. 628]
MTALPSDFSADAVAEIRKRLDEVERSGVLIAFAIESGSRAWGFPSPDSDYDCRFIYIRPVADHLRLEAVRDVIEFPIVGDIDTGGWDLKKALHLALGGNAVVVEWAKSPITYQEDSRFRQRLLALLDEIVEPRKVSRHYLGLARSHLTRVGRLNAEVKLKKLFYLIRPIVALDWMEQHEFQNLPPMNLLECLSGLRLDDGAKRDILQLIDKKKETREMGEGNVPAALKFYLESRYGHHEMNLPPLDDKAAERVSGRFERAQAFYRQEVERFSSR